MHYKFKNHVLVGSLFFSLIFISCSHQKVQDGYDSYKTAFKNGQRCGDSIDDLPSQSEQESWSEGSGKKVKDVFMSCLKSYMTLESHAQSLEFFKEAFKELDIKAEKISLGPKSHLVAHLDSADPKAKTVILFHPTNLINGQLVSQEGAPTRYMWGQKKIDVRSMGILQIFSMAFAKLKKAPLKKNLIFIAANHGNLEKILTNYPNAEVVLNEGGYSFEKHHKKIFLLGTEQKGGAWLRLTHKNPGLLMSHLDQLMAVFLPHEPRDFKGPSPCQLISFSTFDQKVNVVPYKVDLELDCKNLNELQVGKAFSHQNVSFLGKKVGDRYYVSIELSYTQQEKLGEISALQVAAQGLQRLSIIPYRDWSFEEPGFYSHQRTPASEDFAKKLKEVYSTQSAWGDLLWEFAARREWASMQRYVPPDKKGGPERLFRTTCHWTGFDYNAGRAEAYVDCRLLHTGVVNGSQAQYFANQLQKNSKDPNLNIQVVKGWNYIKSDNKSSIVNIIKQEVKKNYPKAFISSWITPASLGATYQVSTNKKIPSYGVYPVLMEDFLEKQNEDYFPESQAYKANKIYSGIVSRLVQ